MKISSLSRGMPRRQVKDAAKTRKRWHRRRLGRSTSASNRQRSVGRCRSPNQRGRVARGPIGARTGSYHEQRLSGRGVTPKGPHIALFEAFVITVDKQSHAQARARRAGASRRRRPRMVPVRLPGSPARAPFQADCQEYARPPPRARGRQPVRAALHLARRRARCRRRGPLSGPRSPRALARGRDCPRGEKFGTHSGLGLSISKQIVEAHRGMIWAENRKDASGAGTGARFCIRLPSET